MAKLTAGQDLLALQTQVAQLRAALDKIEVLVAEGYYATDDETAWLKRINAIIAVITDARGD